MYIKCHFKTCFVWLTATHDDIIPTIRYKIVGTCVSCNSAPCSPYAMLRGKIVYEKVALIIDPNNQHGLGGGDD